MDEKKIQELVSEIKTVSEKRAEEVKNIGTQLTETKNAYNALLKRYDELEKKSAQMQTQLDAMDAKTQGRIVPGADERKSLGDLFVNEPEFLEAKNRSFGGKRGPFGRPLFFKSSAFPLERKDVTETLLGTATSGVLVQQRLPGVVGLPQQALRIRDVMRVIPQATGNSFDFVYQDTRTNAASPQVEGNTKAESTSKWSSASGVIQTLAHFMDVSKQCLADIPGMRRLIDEDLTYGLKVKEEAEILTSDGSGVHLGAPLGGIVTQATAFDTSLLVASDGWERMDILRLAKLQARLAGLATYPPSAFVLNPTDLARIELTKDTTGRYLVGDPITGTPINYIWGLPVVESDSITAGTFLVGAFLNGAVLIDRQEVTIDISYEHNLNYTTNMATILCEERLGLAVIKPTSFVAGSFSTSPA